MLRIGYPGILPAELLRDFPEGVELIPIPDPPDHDIDIDVWIPDPYSNLAMRAYPRLRGVRLVLSLMAGTEWIPPLVGPHVTICNARGAHNIATAEWTLTAILSMLKYFPMYHDIQREGAWKRRFEAPQHYAAIAGDKRPWYPPVLLEELTGKTVLLVGYGAIGKEIERMLAPFHVDLLRMARSARTEPEVHAVSDLDKLLPRAEVVVLILPSTEESQGLICADAAGHAAGELRARADCADRCAGGSASFRQNSCGGRRDRSRAASGGASVVELPESANHASHCRIEPAVCAARAAYRGRRAVPLYERRAAA
jgi:hypothetical protein